MTTPKAKQKSIYTARTAYEDRSKKENESFQELNVDVLSLDTALLLLNSPEDFVVISVLNRLVEFVRKQEENITELQNHNMLKILMDKHFFVESSNALVRRFALYLLCAYFESINPLTDIDHELTLEIYGLCFESYLKETDDFCIEYLSVTINKCLDDPQVTNFTICQYEFLEKYFFVISKSPNPDVLLHSFGALHKMLDVLDVDGMKIFSTCHLFPIDRVISELCNEFPEIRSAALKVIKDLIVDISNDTPFADRKRCLHTLRQLVDLFCKHAQDGDGAEAVDVLATAMRTEKMSHLYFEQNLFEKTVQNLDMNESIYPLAVKCRALAIFAENAKFTQYLQRLYQARLTEIFIACLLEAGADGPPTHVLLGLNRMINYPEAANKIVDTNKYPIVPKLIAVMAMTGANIMTREQAAELVGNMLTVAFNPVGDKLVELNVAEVLAKILELGLPELSVDFILPMLNIIEQLAQNDEYRTYLCGNSMLITNLALLLKHSFTAAVLVSNLFRCLCTLVDEEPVRPNLLEHFICNSINRGLKSLSNLVKTSVTNFIMQTARFPEMVNDYIDKEVLETLIFQQKDSTCVSTWNPAIDSILSKNPGLKFCIRNHLSFTDITTGHDFFVSTKKLKDFRLYLTIIKENVSPLLPVLVVNFNRPENPPDFVFEVPADSLEALPIGEGNDIPHGWCYCRRPADAELPLLLDLLNEELERNGLIQNPQKMKRCIDFDNVARRAKVIAEVVAGRLSENLKSLDLNSFEECSTHIVKSHLHDLAVTLHCNLIPIGTVRSGCQFERAILFKALADQIGLPCTLHRSAETRLLFNEVPLPLEIDHDIHCDIDKMKIVPWRKLRPTHIVDLIYNVGELYPIQSREAMQYLRLY